MSINLALEVSEFDDCLISFVHNNKIMIGSLRSYNKLKVTTRTIDLELNRSYMTFETFLYLLVRAWITIPRLFYSGFWGKIKQFKS